MKKSYIILLLISIGIVSLFVVIGNKKQSYLSSDSTTEEESQEESSSIFVQVAGAVKNPGVYELDADARVYQAIKKAGGLTDDADDESLNQASKLTDGSKIIVKTKAQVAEEALASEDSDLVNINEADESKLTTLTGIGQSKAQAIIAYREEHGGFSSIEDIKNVSGIGDEVYSKIKNLITV